MLIDLSSDKGLAHFHAITRVLNLPEFVKQADFQEQIEVEALPADAFADPLEKMFPIHTKSAAYLSYAYFQKQAAQIDAKARRRCDQGFQKAASFWGLVSEYAEIAKAMQPKVEKTASPGLTPSFVMNSAEKLAANHAEYPFSERNALAKQIMRDAADVGLPLEVIPEAVHKMAGCGLTTKSAVLYELTRRYDNEKRSSLSQPLKVCIDAIQGLQSELIGGEVCEKIAAVIDRYDRIVPGATSTPETVLFAFTKHAADKMATKFVTLVDGTTYAIEDLEKSAEALNVLADSVNLKDLYDLGGALNMTKVADLLETLPRTDAENVKAALRILGTVPVTLDKTAMVSKAVGAVLNRSPFTVVAKPLVKRSDVLQRLEAQDPIVRRAMETMRQLKTAECGHCEDDDKKEKKSKAPTARGIGGLFISHAPNSDSAAPAK